MVASTAVCGGVYGDGDDEQPMAVALGRRRMRRRRHRGDGERRAERGRAAGESLARGFGWERALTER